jgi:transglycosylase-like protein with SLT domain
MGHALVISLGFVLVVPAMHTPVAPELVAAQYSGHVLLVNPDRGRTAVEMREIPKAHTMEERPGPPLIPLASPSSAPQVASLPAPPKVFTPPPGSGGDGLAAIYAVFGNSPGLSWALRVANCESHYNPLALNRSSGASGLFQFMPSTWNANFPGQNIWDPYAQARGALVFYNAGRQSAWTCK